MQRGWCSVENCCFSAVINAPDSCAYLSHIPQLYPPRFSSALPLFTSHYSCLSPNQFVSSAALLSPLYILYQAVAHKPIAFCFEMACLKFVPAGRHTLSPSLQTHHGWIICYMRCIYNPSRKVYVCHTGCWETSKSLTHGNKSMIE